MAEPNDGAAPTPTSAPTPMAVDGELIQNLNDAISNAVIEGDEVEDLDLTFDDIDESQLAATLNNIQPTTVTTTADSNAPSCQAMPYFEEHESYILGTLIVRVVAARELTPINGSGLGLFKGGGGSSNPYANVRFMGMVQRTSEVYNTTDPIWPRGEAMYMDVTHLPPNRNLGDDDSFVNIAKPGKQLEPPKAHPGDPPKKAAPAAAKPQALDPQPASIGASKPAGSPKGKADPLASPHVDTSSSDEQTPTLTVAIFHANERGRLSKFPNKGETSGDSDDTFLGMATIDLTQVLTGKVNNLDKWLPLTGSQSQRASVRIVAEYEPSDAPPHPGDIVKFTDFCNPIDLFPATANRNYTVMEVDGDELQICWTSPEGWVSSFQVHRYQIMVLQRHHNLVELYQDELASIRERISHSPMIHAVNETIQKVPDEGILSVGAEAIQNTVGLLGRWWQGGLGTTAEDLNFATNWDGRQNPDPNLLDTYSTTDDDMAPPDLLLETTDDSKIALPNMPNCPITGEPMRDPVVAADGHTYERTAIARWFLESNKSPLTGSVLTHKDLVPNYMLLSSLQEAAVTLKDDSPSEQVDEQYSNNNKMEVDASESMMQEEKSDDEDDELGEVPIETPKSVNSVSLLEEEDIETAEEAIGEVNIDDD